MRLLLFVSELRKEIKAKRCEWLYFFAEIFLLSFDSDLIKLFNISRIAKGTKHRTGSNANALTRCCVLLYFIACAENDVKKTNCRHCGWCVGESGGIGFTPHTQPGVLFSGIMSRTHSVHANFSRVFATKPWVSVGITHLDVFNNANVRIDVAVDAISTSGFHCLRMGLHSQCLCICLLGGL